jgi:hypothetical protein
LCQDILNGRKELLTPHLNNSAEGLMLNEDTNARKEFEAVKEGKEIKLPLNCKC